MVMKSMKKVIKKKAVGKGKVRRTVNKKKMVRLGLGASLIMEMKTRGGRADIVFDEAPETHQKVMRTVSLKERAGYPLVRAKGSVDPAKWRTKEGKPVIVDFRRMRWLPNDWGQGVKSTNQTAHSRGTSGGTYTVIMSPDGQTFYHRKDAEAHAGYSFSDEMGRNGQVKLAKQQAMEAVQLARAQIRELSGTTEYLGLDSDASFFKLLTPRERKALPSKNAFHFCVISGRRATKLEGIRDIFCVQSQLLDAGVTPTWYVDEASLQDYRGLGLKAVVGGKLTPARNKALEDARRLGKICVQISDDISAWEYRHGKMAAERTDDAMNAAWKKAQRFIVSPVAAARFLLAKMRGVDGPKPKLGGVYMIPSCARTFGGLGVSRKHFILGDFFVVDTGSKVRFDDSLTLKEDYDFSCQHIRAHGSVYRCDRLTLAVKHYSNSGGAVAVRNDAEEKKNIAKLFAKWPRALRKHPKRRNEVVMRWPSDDNAEEAAVQKARPKKGAALKKRPNNGYAKNGAKRRKLSKSNVLIKKVKRR
jgi:hypothetical protein